MFGVLDNISYIFFFAYQTILLEKLRALFICNSLIHVKTSWESRHGEKGYFPVRILQKFDDVFVHKSLPML